MYTVDFGGNSVTIFNDDDDSVRKISHQDFLNVPRELPEGSLLVCEHAHMGCVRERLSKSQPFTKDELVTFYEDCKENGIQFRLWPHHLTARARAEYGDIDDKSDEKDARAIAYMVKKHPEICMLKPSEDKLSFSPLQSEQLEFRKETNFILNDARSIKYKDDNLEFLKGIVPELIDLASDEEVFLDVFDIQESKRKNVKYNNPKNLTPLMYTLQSFLIDGSGNPRYRPSTGGLPGWKFIKSGVLVQSPFHFRGGVARSNIVFHSLRSYTNKKAKEDGFMFGKKTSSKQGRSEYDDFKNDKFRSYRLRFNKALKECFIGLRTLIGIYKVSQHPGFIDENLYTPALS